jgi:FkbM family methyltransferase
MFYSHSSLAIFRQFAHRVVCAEPGPKAVEMLTRRLWHDRRITVLAKAVGDVEGLAELRVFRDAEPCNTVSIKDNDRDGQLVTMHHQDVQATEIRGHPVLRARRRQRPRVTDIDYFPTVLGLL